MKIAQSNFLNMVKAVYDLFMRYPEIWENRQLIKQSVERILEMWNKIRRTAMLQEQNKTNGYTAEKDRQRKLLETNMYRFAGRLKIYAESKDDGVTVTQMTFTRTGLSKLSLNKLITKVQLAIEIAELMLPVPDVYEINEDVIAELADLMSRTEEMNAHRDVVYGERSEHTASLKRQFDALRKELKLMDMQIESYVDNEDFIRTYFFTRKVYDVKGGGKKKEEIE